MGAKLIEVIETTLTKRGDGKDDPVRFVTQYWSKDGELLAERDPATYGYVVLKAAAESSSPGTMKFKGPEEL